MGVLIAKVESKLIDNWRKAWRLWSIRLGVAGMAVATFFTASPEAAYYAWAMLPDDLKAHVPQSYAQGLGVFLFGTSMIARIVKQPKAKVGETVKADPESKD